MDRDTSRQVWIWPRANGSWQTRTPLPNGNVDRHPQVLYKRRRSACRAAGRSAWVTPHASDALSRPWCRMRTARTAQQQWSHAWVGSDQRGALLAAPDQRAPRPRHSDRYAAGESGDGKYEESID